MHNQSELKDSVLIQSLLASTQSNSLTLETFNQLITRLKTNEPLPKELLDALGNVAYLFSRFNFGRQTGLNLCARLIITHSREMYQSNQIDAWKDDVKLLLSNAFDETGLNFGAHQRLLAQHTLEESELNSHSIESNFSKTLNYE